MKIVFLLAVFWIQRYAVTGAIPNCCTSKNVGGLEYNLLRVEDTSQYNCLTNCVYEKIGEPGLAYCFGTGDQKVECKDEASATNGPNNLETKNTTGDNRICGEDLNTLHGLLNASSNTFVAHCCINGSTTNKITCGNGVDCSSVCDVTPTCAKVVVEPEEGEDLCSTRDNTQRQNPCYAYGIVTECNSQGQTSCRSEAFGQDTPPRPNFCKKNTEFVKKADWQDGAACCTCNTCKLCNCCSFDDIIDYLQGITPSQSSPLTSPSQSSSVDIDIDWKRDMPLKTICVSPGTIVQLNWDGDHNVEIIYREDWASCNVTRIDNMTKTGPRNLGPAPNVGQHNSYFFTSGVADDCQHGMKAEITVSNDCNADFPGSCRCIQDIPKTFCITGMKQNCSEGFHAVCNPADAGLQVCGGCNCIKTDKQPSFG